MKKADILNRLRAGELICYRNRYVGDRIYHSTFLTPTTDRLYGDDLHGNNFRGVASQLKVYKKFLNGTEIAQDAVPEIKTGDVFEVYYVTK